MEQATWQVKGMTCEHCVRAVTKAVQSVAGTADVRVDLKSGRLVFKYQPGTDLEQIKANIADAGYEVA